MVQTNDIYLSASTAGSPMPKITCPYCLTDIYASANSCATCFAQISYGKIPEDALGFIAAGATTCSLIAMNIAPKIGIQHPFITFFVILALMSFAGLWRASKIHENVITWKKVRLNDGNELDGILDDSWDMASFDFKLRHGFELHYRGKYGYRPAWDSQRNEFVVLFTQNKWILWRAFFLGRRNLVMTINSPFVMGTVYSQK
jgi:hypothetical protein